MLKCPMAPISSFIHVSCASVGVASGGGGAAADDMATTTVERERQNTVPDMVSQLELRLLKVMLRELALALEVQ